MNYVSEQNIDNIVKGLSNKIAMSVSNGSLIGDTTPVGTVISFMGTQAPLYYLVCDGTTYNIVDYVELANFIEAQFGTVDYFGGDGTTTFAVPDLRGEFLRGTGTNSHENQGSGANVGTHQDGTEIPDIYLYDSTLYFDKTARCKTEKYDSKIASGGTRTWIAGTGSQTSGEPEQATIPRPTNTSVLYCIKYTKAVIPSEYEDGTPVGRVVFDCILRDGYIKANGAQIEDATIAIPRLLSFVQKYSSQILAPDQATYEDNVGLYLYDNTTDTLTLPNYIGRFMEGGNSVESIEAGLPNIKSNEVNSHIGAIYGTWPIADATDNAPFTFQTWASGQTLENKVDALYDRGAIGFDASRSSSIYSDSVNTVQPSSITLIPQIRY